MPQIRFGVLGPLSITYEGRELRIGGARQRAVLALLLLRHDRIVSVDALVDAVWGEAPPHTCRTQIAICVAALRKLLKTAGCPDDVIATSHPGYRLRTEGHFFDLAEFRVLADRAVAAAAAGRTEESATLYGRALGLWRGPALAGLPGRGVEDEAAWLEEQRLTVFDEYAELRLRLGRHHQLVPELSALVREHPFRERTRCSLMLAQYRSGGRGEALSVYQEGRRLVVEELGLEPGAALQALHTAILREDPVLTPEETGPRPGAGGPVDDPAAARTAAEASGAGPGGRGGAGTGSGEEAGGGEDDPPVPAPVPPAAPDGTALSTPPSDLPPNVPAFTGRVAELAALDALLTCPAERDARAVRDGRSRQHLRAAAPGSDPYAPADGRPDGDPPGIALLTGVAGVGKTALAVHWSHRAAGAFPDGSLFVDLGRRPPGGDPAGPVEVLGRLLRILGVSGEALPGDEAGRVSLYRTLLKGRRILLILDDAPSFAHVGPLLPASGGCCVVVTSREAMEELVLRNGATRIPLGVLGPRDSTELLGRIVTGDRITAAPRHTDRLVELCDGLPLALCIAAARLATRPHWTVARLTERLADERRRLDELSLGESRVRASFALSYRCLSPRAAAVYRRIGLLDVPDVTAWAVAALLDCPLSEAERQLDDLADAHLLAVTGPDATGQLRYRFQSLLRLYARERAQEEPDQEALAADRDRALHSWLTVAEEAHRREYGGDHSVVHGPAPRPHVDRALMEDLLARPLDWFESERHCLTAAVGQAAGLGLAALAWDLAACVAGFCEIRSSTDDWRRVCEQGLAAARTAGDARGEGAMLAELGAAHLYRGELPDAAGLLESAERVFRRTGDAHGLALTHCKLAVVERQRGLPGQAAVRLRQALPDLRAAGDTSAQAHALNNLAQIALDAGRVDEAVGHGEQAVALARTLGPTRGAAQAFHRLGLALLAAGRPDAAETALIRAAEVVRAKGDRLGTAYVLLGLAETRLSGGRTTRAATDLHTGLDLAEHTGSPLLLGRYHLLLGRLRVAEDRPADALEATGRAHELFTRAGNEVWRRRAAAQSEELAAALTARG